MNVEEPVIELTDEDTGCWHVQTETSTYLIDLDARTATRLPGDGTVPEGSPAVLMKLRKDGAEFAVKELIACTVGEPMVLFASGIADDPDVFTYRRTTFVQAILPA